MGSRKMAAALWMSASVIALTGGALPAGAQTTTTQQAIDIPAQDAGDALAALMRQTRLELAYPEAVVRGVRTKAVRGRMSARQALDAMLAGTTLEAVSTPSGGITVRPIGAADAQAPGGGEALRPENDIVVTGTRLSEEFVGLAPVQVIDAQTARRSGLTDTGTLLRAQPQVSGPRSNLSYTSGELTESYAGGPGTQTISLRGFAPEQTLVLVNGRRIVTAGVEGVPGAPDIGLIPQALVRRYEILTEGGSPVYGSDAVAGIVNIILDEDFTGFDISGFHTVPESGSGLDQLYSMRYGKAFDNGFITVAAEHRSSSGLRRRDVNFYGKDCASYYDQTSEGRRVDLDLVTAQLPGAPLNSCIYPPPAFVSGAFLTNSSIFNMTEGRSNVGVPNYSLNSLLSSAAAGFPNLNLTVYDSDGDGKITTDVFDSEGFPVQFGDLVFPDPDGDGLVGFDPKSPDYDLTRRSGSGNAFIAAPLKQTSVYTFGKYDVPSADGLSLYFEGSFSRRRSDIRTYGRSFVGLFSPQVSVNNPTNPCSLEAFEAGVVCPSNDGIAAPQRVSPVVSFVGDGEFVKTRVDQYRAVVGATGDLPFLDGDGEGLWGSSGWKYDISAIYGRSKGVSSRPAFLLNRFQLSLQTTVRDPNSGSLVCGADEDGDGLPDPTPVGEVPCVPINVFTPDAMLRGQLTPGERAYVSGKLDYETIVEQKILSGVLKGSFGNLGAGPINWVLGAEHRIDSINATPNATGGDPNNFLSIYSLVQKGAKGTRTVSDGFIEVGVPLLADRRFAHRLDFSAAGRVTREQFSGTNATYALRARYEPTSWLAFRGTYGTAFRSPGLPELFLVPSVQSAGAFFSDPCLVPFQASSGGVYNPANDTRNAATLEVCRSQGLDPTKLGLGVAIEDRPSVTISTGGVSDSRDLKPETSKSLTLGAIAKANLGFVESKAWMTSARLTASATYYELTVTNRIVPGIFNVIVADCYRENDTLPSRFCGRIDRDSQGFITNIDQDYYNADFQTTRGVDFNVLLSSKFNIGPRPFDLSLDVGGNYEIENRIGFFQGFSDNVSGWFYYPKLKLLSTLQLRQGDWIGTLFSSYIGPQTSTIRNPGFGIRTCLGEEVAGCERVFKLEDYVVHNASLTWSPGAFAFSVGVNNVFDVEPPRVSGEFDISGVNFPRRGNYDLFGRSFVFQVRKQF